MLLVIFGAGASHDSVNASLNGRPFREVSASMPPLATNLFDDRSDYQNIMNRYPAIRGIGQDLRQRIRAGENVEDVLQSLAESPYPRNKKGVAAARFYLQDLIKETTEQWYNHSDGMTNYDRLLNQIDDALYETDEQVLLVTFNYDLLLENALVNHDCKFDQIDDYISGTRYKLIKPHGSINWKQLVQFRVLDNNWRKELVEEPDKQTVLIHEQFIIDNNIGLNRDNEGVSRVPVIAIPTTSKTDFLCPQNHFELLTRLLPSARHTLIIGWRGTEKHFTELLGENLGGGRGTIGIVSRDEGSCESIKQTLREEGLERGFGYKEYVGGFSGFVETDNIRALLD